jgi:hypothetical protein
MHLQAQMDIKKYSECNNDYLQRGFKIFSRIYLYYILIFLILYFIYSYIIFNLFLYYISYSYIIFSLFLYYIWLILILYLTYSYIIFNLFLYYIWLILILYLTYSYVFSEFCTVPTMYYFFGFCCSFFILFLSKDNIFLIRSVYRQFTLVES